MARQDQNADILNPPPTDHGTLPNLCCACSEAHRRLESSGLAREITMRGLRWHKEAEWAFRIAGRARITAATS